MAMVNILIAEKSNTARQAIVDALARLDAIAVQEVVSDLHGAVRSLCRQTPDLVVTGIELADASGLDLIEAVRQLAPASRIVVVGASPGREVWRREAASGGVRFVADEPNLRELCAVVAALAGSSGDRARQASRPGDAPAAVGDDELRLLGRITAGVAHDLNNYLGATSALLALLETAPADPELIARARSSVDQAQRLTGSLVSYARGSSPGFEAVDLAAIVDRTLALVAPLIARSVEVRTDMALRLPAVWGSPAELEQLVLNLVLNAADAMPRGGELTVRVHPGTAAVVCLEVSDTGAGMAIDAMGGSDGLSVSTKPGRRAGLGLGIVRRVVERHGGSIRFAPRLDRSGSIVWALLPQA
jgi:signal transduction histidine kinase